MFKIDDEQIKEFESDLKTFKFKALPFATKGTLNRAAVLTQDKTKTRVRNQMITRNKFTENSFKVLFVKTLKISDQESVVGSIAPYMDEQEFGGTKTKTGKHGVSIPTSVASGEGRGAQPRRKKIPKARRLGSIALKNNRPKVKSQKQDNFLRIQQAITSGRKFVFMDLQRHPGIFRISGGKRNPKIDQIYDLSRKSVPIPKNPTLGPSSNAVQKQMAFIYKKQLEKQLRRHGLFKG